MASSVKGAHEPAMARAKEASDAYVRLILKDLEGYDAGIETLLGIGKSAVFVIDTTGSMDWEIDQLKTIVPQVGCVAACRTP